MQVFVQANDAKIKSNSTILQYYSKVNVGRDWQQRKGDVTISFKGLDLKSNPLFYAQWTRYKSEMRAPIITSCLIVDCLWKLTENLLYEYHLVRFSFTEQKKQKTKSNVSWWQTLRGKTILPLIFAKLKVPRLTSNNRLYFCLFKSGWFMSFGHKS